MADSDMDRTEQPTPYKLQKAREQGQIAKSAEFASVVVFIVAVVYLYWKGANLWEEQFLFDRAIFSKAGQFDITEASWWWLAMQMIRHVFSLLAPFLAIVGVAAVVGNLAQTGPVFTLAPLKANWARLNPVEGFKKLLAPRKLFECLRACAKLGLMIVVAYHALKATIGDFNLAGRLAPRTLLKVMTADLAAIGFKIALVLAVIALGDLV